MEFDRDRRRLVRDAGAAVLVFPLVWHARPAAAQVNAALRAQLKYQDQPMDGKDCSQCLEFLPGAGPADPGGCKVIPGDTEIAPQGWCTTWNTL